MIERDPKDFLINNVRELSHKIIDTSYDVLTINYKSLESTLAQHLSDFKENSNQSSVAFIDESLSPENELGLNLFLNVINFCYEDPNTRQSYSYLNKAGKNIIRSTGLKAAMVESDINWGSTEEVAEITPEKWAKIVQLQNNPNFYLGAERGKRIVEFSKKLNLLGATNISDLLSWINYDTDTFLLFLSKSGYFKDEFQKRSQLSVNMMDGVLKRRFNKEFKGADSLTVMADYRLPQLMYNFGTIELSESLKEKLIKEEIIQTGSREELALRAATVVVGEKLGKLMSLPEGQVDSLLWTLSIDLTRNDKLVIPHMLVPTDKYLFRLMFGFDMKSSS